MTPTSPMHPSPPPTTTRSGWRAALIIACAAWVFWGAWRVWELLVENVPTLASWRADLLATIRDGPFALKAISLVLFLAAYLLWAALPAWILLVLGIVREERSLTRGILRALTEVVGSLAGTIVLLLLWFAGTLFLAFFGDLIDVIGAVIVLAAITVAFVMELIARTSRVS